MMVNFETEASKLCAQGVTIVVSSGDDGAVNIGCSSCNPNQAPSQDNCACQANSGSSIPWSGPKWTGTGYFPSFPATVPYVTAVGATMGNGQPSIVPFINGQEIACQVRYKYILIHLLIILSFIYRLFISLSIESRRWSDN